MRRKVYLLVLLSAAGRPALAQWWKPSTEPLRVAVGAQAALYPQLAWVPATAAGGGSGLGRPWPAQLTVRLDWGRRSAELGLLLRADPAAVSSYADAHGTTTTRATGRAWLVPLVGRWQVGPARAQPWRFTLDAGFMLAHSQYEAEATFQDARTGATSNVGSSSLTTNDLPLLLGAGAAYQLTPHVSLTADARLSWSLFTSLVSQAFTGRAAPAEPACGLGVAYRFGATP